MYRCVNSNTFQLETNTESRIGRVNLGTSHIADITESSVIVYHPEVFHSIDDITSNSDIHFEFPESLYQIHIQETQEFKIILALIRFFRQSIGLDSEQTG